MAQHVELNPELAPDRRAAARAAYFYGIRTATVLGALALGALYVGRLDALGAFHYAIFALGLSYPHLAHYLVRRLDAGRRVEHFTVLIDNFVAGCLIYLVGFTLWPSFAIGIINLMNPMAFGGLPLMLGSAAVLAASAVMPLAVFGAPLVQPESTLINFASCTYLFVYLCLFAHAVYLRTRALQASRRELRQQKMALEVAKRRSDNLLGSILPPHAVAEYESQGKVAPSRFDAAILMLLDAPQSIDGKTNEAVHAAAQFMLQAVDAIAQRHGVYALKNLGDVYLALGNAPPVASAELNQVIAAAKEISRLGVEEGRPLRIAIHCGPLVAAVIEARKVGYEVFGPALSEALRLHAAAQPGQILLSGAAYALCPEQVASAVGDAYLLAP